MEKNLTDGSVIRNIFVFSLPYLLSYLLQTLYGLTDDLSKFVTEISIPVKYI